MRHDLVLENAEVFYQGQLQRLNVGISNGKIQSLSAQSLEGDKTIDLSGKWILPGLIDSQVHFREPGATHKEDLATGTLSALAGGITAVLEMPNTNPLTVTEDTLQEKVEIAKKKAWVDFGFFIGATHDNIDQLPQLESMEGCCGVKIFMGSSTGSLLMDDDQDLEQVFKTARGPIAVHCEDEKRLLERKVLAEESKDPQTHPVWRDEESAFIATEKVVRLSKKYNRPVHVLHISSKKEILFLEENKTSQITVECTPQHLTLAAPECYEKLGTLAQMNPPVRDRSHMQALVEGLKKGVVDVIGSDHAPHTHEEKAKPYPQSPSGMTGVQTIATVMFDFVQKGHITLARYVDLLSTKPAQIYKMSERGAIELGWEANLTVLDPQAEILFTDEQMHSKCGWTPYHGMKFKGTPSEVFLRGELVMQNGQILGSSQGKMLHYNR